MAVPANRSLGSDSVNDALGYASRRGHEASTPSAGPPVSPLANAWTSARTHVEYPHERQGRGQFGP